MKAYDRYKDCDIAWIDEIPDSWNVRRGKTILNLLNRPIKDDDEIITCFRDGEVTLRKNRREEGFTVALRETGYQGIEPGDLVVHGMDGFAGAIGISDSRGKATPVLNVMDSSQNKKYLMYYLRALAYRDVFMSLSTGIRVRSCDLRWNKLATLPFVLPSIEEQASIVEYLDKKSSQVDAMLADAKQSVEEYKRWRTSVVFEAVTKGINTNVKLKNSGIKWIGLIPASWTIRKIKTGFTIVSGATPKSERPDYWDGDIIWITPADYKTDEKYVGGGRKTLTKEGYDSCGTTIVPSGSVIFSKRAPVGTVAINTVPLCTNQGCLSCIPKEGTNSEFFYYVMSVFTEQFELFSSGTTFKEISATAFSNFALPFPQEQEQIEIASYLREKCEKINRVILEKIATIDDLETYKRSLIYEVITGKRKVV